MRENAGRRTDSGSDVGPRKRKGQEPGVITARSLNQLAAPAVDALQSCALQHPVACEAIPVPAEAQGDMQATSGFQSGRQFSSGTVKKPTRLGSAKDCAKQGRFARVYGSHWRSQERERLTFAANGLLADIWSYCADQGIDRLSTTAMRKLTAPDQKNAGRMLRQLVGCGYIAETTEGWRVLAWERLYPVAKVSPLRIAEPVQRAASEEAETRAETLVQRSAPPETIQETPSPRARAFTQIPELKKEDSPTESPAASAGPPPKKTIKPPRKAAPGDPLKKLTADGYAEAYERVHGIPASKVNFALVQLIVSWAQKMPDPEAAIRTSLEGYLASWVGQQSRHAMHLWAKNPAGFYAEAANVRTDKPREYSQDLDGGNAEEIIALLESRTRAAS